MVGKIIKSGDAPPSLEPSSGTQARMQVARRAVVDSEEFDAHHRARDIVAQAEATAAHIRAKAQAEREEVFEQARQEGREEGLTEMTAELARAHQERGRMFKQLEPQVVKLAIQVAERIIGAELESTPETIVHIVATAVEQLRQSKEFVIRANPADIEVLRREKRRLLEQIGRLKDIGLKEDASVPRGGCVLQTESGTVDAQLKTQMEVIEHTLLGDPT